MGRERRDEGRQGWRNEEEMRKRDKHRRDWMWGWRAKRERRREARRDRGRERESWREVGRWVKGRVVWRNGLKTNGNFTSYCRTRDSCGIQT